MSIVALTFAYSSLVYFTRERHGVFRVVKKPYRKELSGRISKKRSVTYDIRVKTKSFFGPGFPRSHLHLIDCETIFPSRLECRCAGQLRGTYGMATASRKYENKHLCAEDKSYCKLRKVFYFASIFRPIFQLLGKKWKFPA